uniref:Uncharacterized protein n=1 Tax=Triticum urartu TaxID=4572 RepID=A0A8R7UBU4_TRIUA
MERKRVLVVGGSGYLGQHLLVVLAAGCRGQRRLRRRGLHPPPQGRAAGAAQRAPQRPCLLRRPPLRRRPRGRLRVLRI